MDSILKRREFIRHAGLAGMAAMLPGKILSASLAPLYECGINPGKEFALLKLEKILPGYAFRIDEAFSTRDYELEFRLFNLYKNLAGNRLVFEEINRTLDLAFRYDWLISEQFGFVRRAVIHNLGNQ